MLWCEKLYEGEFLFLTFSANKEEDVKDDDDDVDDFLLRTGSSSFGRPDASRAFLIRSKSLMKLHDAGKQALKLS